MRGILAGAALMAAVVYSPVAYQGIHAWLFPTPEQRAAAEKAEAEYRAQRVAEIRADAEQRAAGVNGNLAARHPGCTFDDLGGYMSPDRQMHPVLAIFCPGQTVTTNSAWSEQVKHGKTTDTVVHLEAVTTDEPAAPGQEQPQ